MLFIFENRTFLEVHEDGLKYIQCGTLLRIKQSHLHSCPHKRNRRDFQVYFLKLGQKNTVSISPLSLGSLGIGRHLDAKSLT